MPVIFEVEFDDGSKEILRFPAESWVKNNQQITKLIITEKQIKSLILDPRLETADTDLSNNFFPPRIDKSRFQLFKERQQLNPMQKANGIKPEPQDEPSPGGNQ